MRQRLRNASAADRFWFNVVKHSDGCWLWRDRSDVYGQIKADDGRKTTAHRFSFELHNGPVPIGMYICHKCDVRGCVNPDHLYAGTHEDNIRDIVERKRHLTKPRDPEKQLRFNRDGVLKPIVLPKTKENIKELYASGSYTQVQIAEHYGLTQSTVSAIIRGVDNHGEGGRRKKSPNGHYRRKLQPDQYAEIRNLYATGQHTQTALAEQFNCDQTYISAIVNHKLRSELT